MEEKAIRIPVKASYRVENGIAVKTEAEYAEVPVRIIAKILKGGMKK